MQDVISPADSSAGLPRRYGKYELLELIGSGGMAEVYLAKLPGIAGFEKTVVVKRLHPEYSQRFEFLQLFVEEAKLAAEVQHKNVVSVFDLGSLEDGEVYMTMEYIAGTDLKNLLRHCNRTKQRLPPWLSVHIVAEVLEALGFAHDLTDAHQRPRNIVHCDVTPENVFLSHIGEVKLGDFGVAQDDARRSDPFDGQLKGKVPYMSPEQLRGERPDRRTDVFAAGIVLWECLTQRRLFAASSAEDTMRRVVGAPRLPPSHFCADVPPELDEVVLAALTIDRDDRVDNARALQVRLLDILEQLRPRRTLSDIRDALASLMPDPRAEEEPQEILELSESAILSDDVLQSDDSVTEDRDPGAPNESGEKPSSGVFGTPSETSGLPGQPFELPEESVTDAGPAESSNDLAHRAWLAMGGDPSRPPPRLPPRRTKTRDSSYGIVQPKHAVDRLDGGPLPYPAAPMPGPAGAVETNDILRNPPERSELKPRSDPANLALPVAPVSAPPPPREDSSASRHPLWVRAPGGAILGPRGPAEALDVLVSLLDGTPAAAVSISSDGKHWLGADRLALLLGEDIVPADPRTPTVAPAGDLQQHSLASVFGYLGRTGATGRLVVVRKTPHGGVRREISVENGQLTGLGSSAEALQVWTCALGSGESAHGLKACLHRVIAVGQPMARFATNADVAALRRARIKVMQTHLQELFSADHGLFGMLPGHAHNPALGHPIPLLRLLPAVVSRARHTADLRRSLQPYLRVALVRSDAFEEETQALRLPAVDRVRLEPFGHGYTLGESLGTCRTAKDEKLGLVLAYLLIELGLLTPYYAHQET